EYLAERVAHVHVIEVDERLRAALADATDAHANVTVHWGDAMRLELGALRPRPLKVVANLPYGIAAPVLLRTIEELPGVGSWVAMVQREVGERLAAAPGSPAEAHASGCARRCGSWATAPTCAPSASPRKTFARWRGRCGHERAARARSGQDQPRAGARAAAAGRRAARDRDRDAVDLAGGRAHARAPPRRGRRR